MILNAASKNETINSFVPEDKKQKMVNNINENKNALSIKQVAGVGGAGLIGAGAGASIGAAMLAGLMSGGSTGALAGSVVPGLGNAIGAVGGAVNTQDYKPPKNMGVMNDGVIYKDGSYAKFAKGDMVQFIDQAAYEKALSGGGMNSGGSGSIQHTGVITIKSDDGKVVTWEQMYNARDLIGSRISSINKSYENGFGNYQDSNISPIKPLM
jgi:hypothetical protein